MDDSNGNCGKHVCVICLDDLGTSSDTSKLHETGRNTVIESSLKRNDVDVNRRVTDWTNVYVHNKCRRTYTDRRKYNEIKAMHSEHSNKILRRSDLPFFEWKFKCFICAKTAIPDVKHPDRECIQMVRTLEFSENLLSVCYDIKTEQGDETAVRLNGCLDLVAAEARYHRSCYVGLMKNRIASDNPSHRPSNEVQQTAFQKLCVWLDVESDADMYSIKELHEKMSELVNGEIVYSEKYFRAKLKEYYGEHVFFAKYGGSRSDVVCFKNMASFIISDKWYNERKPSEVEESQRIIKAAARLLREEIRETPYTNDEYPTMNDIRDPKKAKNFLCSGLKIFLDALIMSEMKRLGIGHAITQAARPRSVISPVLFGIGVEMHHTFGSEWLIDELYSLGFSISINEVTRYRHSILQGQTLKSLRPPQFPVLAQYGADNADSNLRTLDGKGTFHAMAMYTWFKKTETVEWDIRIKRKARLEVSELMVGKDIPIMHYKKVGLPALSNLKFRPRSELQLPMPYIIPPETYYSNILWKSSYILQKKFQPTPEWINWSGYMQHVYRGSQVAQVDQVVILPIIDLNPSDDNCIFSVLTYVSIEAEKLLLPSTSLTFDQPLFIKCTEIADSAKITNVVIRLGGFHLLMSAMGSLYATMKGSGIEEALGQIYATNALPLLLNGKAITRSLRGSNLINAGLHYQLLSKIIDSNGNSGELLNEMQSLLQNVNDSNTINPLELLLNSQAIHTLDTMITGLKTELSEKYQNSRLWIQFINYVEIINEFIICERLGLWHGHLSACSKLLNLLAGTGHIHYAKCARLYLQKMDALEQDHPWLYAKYMDGDFAVKRSDHPLNGLWSDLVIEQVVMASLKNSKSGLTHGRGLSESVRQQWVYSLHMFAAVHDAMSALTGQRKETSQQHVELGKCRSKRDSKDLEVIIEWLEQHDPFTDSPVLRSLSTGIIASDNDGINCDECEKVGEKLQSKMDDCSYNDAKVSRKNQIRTLEDLQSGLVVGTKTIKIDPTVVFSRLASIALRQNLPIEPFLKHEMSLSPPSLFDGELMRKANKAELSSHILKQITETQVQDLPNFHMTIIDGGWLLHRVRWLKSTTYDNICLIYTKFIVSKFGTNVVVVFDGYSGPSTKDHEHQRRQAKKVSASIEVKAGNRCHNDQDAFLGNANNKTQFIALLADYLINKGHTVKFAISDADTLIVKTAVQFAKHKQPVVLVAEDCDILVLLLYHVQPDMSDIILCKWSNRKTPIYYSILETNKTINVQVREHILFVHAWGGCDTTSQTYKQGKLNILKFITKDTIVQSVSRLFFELDQSKQIICESGDKIFVKLYGGYEDTSLLQIRYSKYIEKMDEIVTLDPRTLPPSPRAAYFHSLRVYLQVQRWMKLDADYLDPCDWGWGLNKGQLLPIKTDEIIAPETLLQCIRCKCKTLKRQCGTAICKCRKYGLKCIESCGGCHGETCLNTEIVIDQKNNENE